MAELAAAQTRSHMTVVGTRRFEAASFEKASPRTIPFKRAALRQMSRTSHLARRFGLSFQAPSQFLRACMDQATDVLAAMQAGVWSPVPGMHPSSRLRQVSSFRARGRAAVPVLPARIFFKPWDATPSAHGRDRLQLGRARRKPQDNRQARSRRSRPDAYRHKARCRRGSAFHRR